MLAGRQNQIYLDTTTIPKMDKFEMQHTIICVCTYMYSQKIKTLVKSQPEYPHRQPNGLNCYNMIRFI